ncbi:MAG: alpha-amylase family glycosyl hydrolase, partial [Polyangiales bacterium]
MVRGLPLVLLLAGCGAAGSDLPSAPDSASSTVATLDAVAEVEAAESDASSEAATPSTKLGAEVEGSGVRFRVWAPNATAARVTGDFGEASMTALDDHVFEALVEGAHAGTKYHYVLDTKVGSLTRVDPYCRKLLDAPASALECEVVDPRSYAWKTSTFVRPSRAESIVYELHVGSFAGTFTGARDKLASLAELGINVVELMPVQHFGGDAMRWGYNPQLWHTPKSGLGTPDELRAFVDEAHRLGIAVWLDVVMNHTDGWKGAPLYCFDGCTDDSAGTYFFPPGAYAKTPWGPRPDYTKPRVAEMLLSSVDQWLTEYRGDGFRWDSVSNIRGLDGAGNTPGGRDLLVKANQRTHELGALSIAEDLKGWDQITRKDGFGFDAQWDGFGYAINEVLVPASDDG